MALINLSSHRVAGQDCSRQTCAVKKQYPSMIQIDRAACRIGVGIGSQKTGQVSVSLRCAHTTNQNPLANIGNILRRPLVSKRRSGGK